MSTSSRFVSGGTIVGDGDGGGGGGGGASSATSPASAPASVLAPTSTNLTPASTTHTHTHAHAHTTANPSAPVLHTTTTTSSSTTTPTTSTTTGPSPRTQNPEWEAALASLTAERRQREAARQQSIEGTEQKSLYEILQANKAAKQAAFEDANRLRNQFRALDDDEVDFLDEVRAREREDEERKRRELRAGLEEFRRAQLRSAGAEAGVVDAGEGGAPVGSGSGSGGVEVGIGVGVDSAALEEWAAAGRKRKRDREHEREARGLVKGVKRKASEGAREKGKSAEDESGAATKKGEEPTKQTPTRRESTARDDDGVKNGVKRGDAKISSDPPPPPPPKPAAGIGLVDYGSDDD